MGTGGCSRNLLFSFPLDLSSLLGWRIPVIHHLQSENSVKRKACDESVEDQLVVHLLQRCEDSGERASEVVEDLERCH